LNISHKTVLAAFDSLTIDYTFDYAGYPYGEKIGGSTKSLLKQNLIETATVDEFLRRSLGIIPTSDLLRLSKALTEFTPVYRELVYRPNAEAFEKRLRDLKNLIASTQLTSYMNLGLRFYDSGWER
jgi:hypothetical protein